MPEQQMQTQRPRLLVVDDDRAVLTLVGSGVTCLDVLKVLQTMGPQCEVMLMTGYGTLDAALDAVRRTLHEPLALPSAAAPPPTQTALLVDVERDHIVRTLQQVRGNKAVAARMLGISRRAFYRQLERHGLHQRTPMARRPEPATPRVD
jgi:two-component system response regulator RegA